MIISLNQMKMRRNSTIESFCRVVSHKKQTYSKSTLLFKAEIRFSSFMGNKLAKSELHSCFLHSLQFITRMHRLIISQNEKKSTSLWCIVSHEKNSCSVIGAADLLVSKFYCLCIRFFSRGTGFPAAKKINRCHVIR